MHHQGTEGVRQGFCKATDLTFAFEDRKHDRSFAITKANEVVVVRQLILLVEHRPFAHCYRMNWSLTYYVTSSTRFCKVQDISTLRHVQILHTEVRNVCQC